MIKYEKTNDTLLNGRIDFVQYKKGYRIGFDAVFLSSFVNGYLNKIRNKKFSIADVGSGAGAISLLLAFHNKQSQISAIENNIEFIEIAKENIKKNNFENSITLMQNNVFELDNNLKEKYDYIVSNPPYHPINGQFSLSILNEKAKRTHDFRGWLISCLSLLKNKGCFFIIFRADRIHEVFEYISKYSGSFKIFPFWPKSNSSAKRVILVAKKGSFGPSEIFSGFKLYKKNGILTKRAQLVNEKGIFNIK